MSARPRLSLPALALNRTLSPLRAVWVGASSYRSSRFGHGHTGAHRTHHVICHRERLFHGRVNSEQIVQLFDDLPTLADVVSAFLRQGHLAGARLLVTARDTHWAAVSARLAQAGWSIDAMRADGQLVVVEAATAVTRLWSQGAADRAAFDALVGLSVRELCSRGPLCIYTEVVDMLIERGSYDAALGVEQFWDALAEECSFRLLYGYTSSRLAANRALASPRVSTPAHGTSTARDLIATWRLDGRRWFYPADSGWR